MQMLLVHHRNSILRGSPVEIGKKNLQSESSGGLEIGKTSS